MKRILHTVRESFGAMLRQGLAPREFSLAVASGTTISLLPLPGTTTLLNLAVARAAGLNLVVSQAANWLASPLQALLLVPLMKAGARMLSIDDSVLSGEMIHRIAADGPFSVLLELGALVPAAVVAWALIAVPLFAALYAGTRLVLRIGRAGRSKPAEMASGG